MASDTGGSGGSGAESSSTSSGNANSWQNAAQNVVRPKMDVAKALAILGFSSSRSLDPAGGKI